LGDILLLDVKNGKYPLELPSSFEARLAVKPMDYAQETVNFLISTNKINTNPFGNPWLDDMVKSHKSAAKNKQDIQGINVICVRFGCRIVGINLIE
jgi:hypothetical protein